MQWRRQAKARLHTPHRHDEDAERPGTHHAENVASEAAANGVPMGPQSLAQRTVLHLQRTLGNQAVMRLLAKRTPRKAPPVRRTGQPAVQRDVGFEFEIKDVKTYGPGAKILKKKDKLLYGMGFTMEADEMPGYSDLEFVTHQFQETPEGGMALADTLYTIASIVDMLEAKPNKDLPAEHFKAFGKPEAEAGRYMRASDGPLVGKPQATAGIRLDVMDRLFFDAAQRPGAPDASNKAATVLGGQMQPALGTAVSGEPAAGVKATGMATVSKARNAALREIDRFLAAEKEFPVDKKRGNGALTALVTQLSMYLVQGAMGVPGYGKTIAGEFMQRTDFAQTFRHLPRVQIEYFQKNPDLFVILVCLTADFAARDSGFEGDVQPDGAVFSGGLYNDEGMYRKHPHHKANLLPELRRHEWLTGIVKGIDLLTAKTYPKASKEQQEELESLGSYEKFDFAATPQSGRMSEAPIVELRGLKAIPAGLFPVLALDLFRYVHEVNTEGKEGYPGQLLSLPDEIRADLIEGQKKALGARKKVIQVALAEIMKWK